MDENREVARPKGTIQGGAATGAITVICGANTARLTDTSCIGVGEIRRRLREVLNLTDDHRIVLVNGKPIPDGEIGTCGIFPGDEVEFKKPAGQKG